MQLVDGSDVSPDVLDAVFTQAVIQHPPPYDIDQDWTIEVFSTTTGGVIAKCDPRKGLDPALKVVREATAWHRHIQAIDTELDE